MTTVSLPLLPKWAREILCSTGGSASWAVSNWNDQAPRTTGRSASHLNGVYFSAALRIS
jgi:hypothetical protein